MVCSVSDRSLSSWSLCVSGGLKCFCSHICCRSFRETPNRPLEPQSGPLNSPREKKRDSNRILRDWQLMLLMSKKSSEHEIGMKCVLIIQVLFTLIPWDGKVSAGRERERETGVKEGRPPPHKQQQQQQHLNNTKALNTDRLAPWTEGWCCWIIEVYSGNSSGFRHMQMTVSFGIWSQRFSRFPFRCWIWQCGAVHVC